MRRPSTLLLVLHAAASLAACKPTFTMCPEKMPSGVPTVAEAEAFIANTETELLRLVNIRDRASWIRATHITHDTEAMSSATDEAVMEFTAKRSAMSTRYDKLTLPPDVSRKFMLLKISQTLPAPADAKKRTELAALATNLEGVYGKGKYCSPKQGGKCLALGELSDILAKSRDFWTRAYKGSDVAVMKLGPKECRFEIVGNVLAEGRYWRASLGGIMTAMAGAFCRRVFVRELAWNAAEPGSARYRMSWV